MLPRRHSAGENQRASDRLHCAFEMQWLGVPFALGNVVANLIVGEAEDEPQIGRYQLPVWARQIPNDAIGNNSEK